MSSCHGAQQNFTDAFSLAKSHFDSMFIIFLLVSKLQCVGGKEKRTKSSERGQEAERDADCVKIKVKGAEAQKKEPQRKSARAAL